MSGMTIPTWTLGDRLAKARQAAGINSQARMAEALGVTERTIRNWETGSTKVKDATVIAYAVVTGVPRWWIEGVAESDDDRAEPDRAVRSRCFPSDNDDLTTLSELIAA